MLFFRAAKKTDNEKHVMADHPKDKPDASSSPRPETKTIELPKDSTLDGTKRIVPPPLPRQNDPLAKWVAWSTIIVVPLTVVAILVAVFPTESHDYLVALLHGRLPAKEQPHERPAAPPNNPPGNQPQPGVIDTHKIDTGNNQVATSPLPPDRLLRYTTFSVSGDIQQGYKFSDDSTVIIDRDTGHEIDARISVIAPDGSKEVFIATPWYQDEGGSMWQWHGQGSLRGSLDFQYKPHTFVDYVGGKPLSHSAYQREGGPILLSTNTILRPLATASTYP